MKLTFAANLVKEVADTYGHTIDTDRTVVDIMGQIAEIVGADISEFTYTKEETDDGTVEYHVARNGYPLTGFEQTSPDDGPLERV